MIILKYLLKTHVNDIYENIEEYYPIKERKILMVFGDMIADMLVNKKPQPVVTELFIIENWRFFFYYTILICCIENITLNSSHYFIMKILNKQELQQIAFNHSSDIDVEDFMKLYKKMYYKTIFFFS